MAAALVTNGTGGGSATVNGVNVGDMLVAIMTDGSVNGACSSNRDGAFSSPTYDQMSGFVPCGASFLVALSSGTHVVTPGGGSSLAAVAVLSGVGSLKSITPSTATSGSMVDGFGTNAVSPSVAPAVGDVVVTCHFWQSGFAGNPTAGALGTLGVAHNVGFRAAALMFYEAPSTSAVQLTAVGDNNTWACVAYLFAGGGAPPAATSLSMPQPIRKFLPFLVR